MLLLDLTSSAYPCLCRDSNLGLLAYEMNILPVLHQRMLDALDLSDLNRRNIFQAHRWYLSLEKRVLRQHLQLRARNPCYELLAINIYRGLREYNSLLSDAKCAPVKFHSIMGTTLYELSFAVMNLNNITVPACHFALYAEQVYTGLAYPVILRVHHSMSVRFRRNILSAESVAHETRYYRMSHLDRTKLAGQLCNSAVNYGNQSCCALVKENVIAGTVLITRSSGTKLRLSGVVAMRLFNLAMCREDIHTHQRKQRWLLVSLGGCLTDSSFCCQTAWYNLSVILLSTRNLSVASQHLFGTGNSVITNILSALSLDQRIPHSSGSKLTNTRYAGYGCLGQTGWHQTDVFVALVAQNGHGPDRVATSNPVQHIKLHVVSHLKN
ncbi:hypothetical protein CSKR_100972 [Clonorchis sinensis]|uniref:Uncharacterized protein n=1 Tax=Clonorchis sinensis TaxID=79923 RepID=A0A419Q499_CLOSI|nr:hypothetical protein CSKR_100972 [Clonorchis sinensis]